MPIVVFKGTVRPMIHNLSIAGLPQVRYGWQNPDLTVDIAVKIAQSKVEVLCDATRFDKTEHLSMLAMHAYNLSSAAVDSFCFYKGVGLTVFLESFVDVDGRETNLAAHSEEVGRLCTAFDLDPSYRGPNNIEAIYSLVVKDRLLLLALNDLVVPISRFDLAAINCARSIEALRTSMTPVGMDRKQGWLLMQQNLNLGESYLTYVTSLSTGPRHGNRRAPEAGEQAEIIKRAWVIMNRFLEFRKKGDQQLSLTEFPLLS